MNSFYLSSAVDAGPGKVGSFISWQRLLEDYHFSRDILGCNDS
jgi:hypothetical protein